MSVVRLAGFRHHFESYEAADASEAAVYWHSSNDRAKDAVSASFALLELERYLKRSGHTVLREGEAELVIRILPYYETEWAASFRSELRRAAAAQAERYVCRFPAMERDIYRIFAKQEEIVIVGATGVACLYGVYAYLRQIGFAFFAPGEENERIPRLPRLTVPEGGFVLPSFPLRRMYAYKKNRADEALLDWFGKCGVNLWGAENLLPGMRKRGILLGSGNHDLLSVCGCRPDYCVSDPETLSRIRRTIVDQLKKGCFRETDVLDYLGGDMQPRCECERCRAIGNYADRELYIVHEVRKAIAEAYASGYLDRDVPITYYAYGETMQPPARPAPAGFDTAMTMVQLWAFRCFSHRLDDPACCQDWPHVAYAGSDHAFLEEIPSHGTLLRYQRAWKEAVGSCALGFYPYNAGMYFVERSYFLHFSEFSFLAQLGTPAVSYMHLPSAGSTWGFKKLFWFVTSCLQWDSSLDWRTLVQEYFTFYFGERADKAERVARLLDEALSPLQKLKFYLLDLLRDRPETDVCALFDRDDYLSLAGTGKWMPSLEEASRLAGQALALTEELPLSEEERALIAYSAHTARFCHRYLTARLHPEDGACLEDLFEEVSALVRTGPLPPLWLAHSMRVTPLQTQGNMKDALWLLSDHGFDCACVHVQLGPEASNDFAGAYRDYAPPAQNLSPAFSPPLPDRAAPCLVPAGSVETGLRNMGAGFLFYKGSSYVACVGEICGEDTRVRGFTIDPDKRIENGVACIRDGKLLWRRTLENDGFPVAMGPYCNIFEIPETGEAVVTLSYSCKHSAEPGYVDALSLETGELIWRYRTETQHGGNGSAALCDLNRDGRSELIFGLNGEIVCLDASTGRRLWNFTGDEEGRVSICHGSFALADIDGDGEEEILFGIEYGTRYGEKRSSFFVLSSHGQVKRAMHNLTGDVGSTNVTVCDADGDGLLEIAVGALNLVFAEPRHEALLYCFEHYLGLRYDPRPVPDGHFAVASLPDRREKLACFLSSMRDGGPSARTRPGIRLVRLDSGQTVAETPVPRGWLSGSPIACDFDGDGSPEFFMTTFYGSGYGCTQPETFCDAYLVNARGEILWKRTFPDTVYNPAVGTADGTCGRLILPCYDGFVYFYTLPKAPPVSRYLSPGANARRTGCPAE